MRSNTQKQEDDTTACGKETSVHLTHRKTPSFGSFRMTSLQQVGKNHLEVQHSSNKDNY